MNNKAIVDDWRIKLLLPLLWLIDFLLKQKSIASALFGRVKERQNLKDILLSVYGNKDAVDDELVEIIRGPADTEGALDAFVSTVTGPPGPSPIPLMPEIKIPVLVLWGDQDPFTPIDGPVGKYFSGLPSELPNVKLHMLEGVGHCPHDDRPDLVHEKLLPWLANLPSTVDPEVALT
ncbi:pheophytinase, chloroplastic-like [Lolium rigidum]|uniref:pheophytinase, chloroplastic-like n=1 Tax=Lolium rigidum TaxID=89674 RepID=UPI001F5D826B|nr:pheophytinase, chloroplastic-like [Lolium rigidum]